MALKFGTNLVLCSFCNFESLISRSDIGKWCSYFNYIKRKKDKAGIAVLAPSNVNNDAKNSGNVFLQQQKITMLWSSHNKPGARVTRFAAAALVSVASSSIQYETPVVHEIECLKRLLLMIPYDI